MRRGTEVNTDPNKVGIAPQARPWRPRGVRPPSHNSHGGWSPEAIEADRRRIRHALLLTIGVLTLVWGVFLVDLQLNLHLNRFGNRPMRAEGLIGVFSMPFLHGGWDHIWGNTVSFFTLGAMLLYFYRGVGLKVLFWSWIGSGFLLWVSGAPGNHIGLSGVVYALAAFLFASGIIRGYSVLMRVAFVVVFLYGSIVWGVFPIEVGVSWQGHLAGASAGLLLAWVLRKEGPRAPVVEEEEPHSRPAQERHSLPNEPDSAAKNVDPQRRKTLLWKGPPPRIPHRPLQHRGSRKGRKGPHIRSKTALKKWR